METGRIRLVGLHLSILMAAGFAVAGLLTKEAVFSLAGVVQLLMLIATVLHDIRERIDAELAE